MASPDSQTPAADTPVRAFHWTLKTQGVIAPDERLPWPQMVAMGLQHVVAMFGATVLAPLLMGFDPNIAILMSGVGTLIFFFIVRGRVPSYLGSSFAFISVVILAPAVLLIHEMLSLTAVWVTVFFAIVPVAPLALVLLQAGSRRTRSPIAWTSSSSDGVPDGAATAGRAAATA